MQQPFYGASVFSSGYK